MVHTRWGVWTAPWSLGPLHPGDSVGITIVVTVGVLGKAVPVSGTSWSEDKDRYKKRALLFKKKVVITKYKMFNLHHLGVKYIL